MASEISCKALAIVDVAGDANGPGLGSDVVCRRCPWFHQPQDDTLIRVRRTALR